MLTVFKLSFLCYNMQIKLYTETHLLRKPISCPFNMMKAVDHNALQYAIQESCTSCYKILVVLIVGMLVILLRNRVAKYFMKYIFCAMCCTVAAIICLPTMIVTPRNPKNALSITWICRKVTTKILRIFHEVKGHENIVPQGSGCLVLLNHQSMLDLMALSYLFPIFPRSCTIAKREIFWLWPFGLAVWLFGTILIDRYNFKKSRDTINNTAELIKSKQASIMMFPEGTRHCGETLLPFKKGAFHLALTAQCPIQPVVVSKYHFLDHGARRFDTGKVIIQILPAISTKGITKEQLPELIEEVWNLMQNTYENISAEADQKKTGI